jgi:hypothetical protein
VPQGPHHLEDSFGMLKACVLLDHSLSQGINKVNVQLETIHKICSTVSNYDHTTCGELELQCLAGYKRSESQGFTGATMYQEWFNIFTIGYHARIMGDERQPDQAMPIEFIQEVQATLERDLFNARTVNQMLTVCVHAVFIICGFCAGLRVEELPMMSVDSMANTTKMTSLLKVLWRTC